VKGRSRREGGFTLLELAISLMLLGIVSWAASLIASSSNALMSDDLRELTLDAAAERITNRLAEELRAASADTVLPVVLDESREVRFQKVTGFSGVEPQLGPATMIRFEPMAGEEMNGRDDDGDGLTDEGRIVYRIDGSDPEVLSENVRGVSFTATVNGISFRGEVSLPSSDGPSSRRAFSRRISFRN